MLWGLFYFVPSFQLSIFSFSLSILCLHVQFYSFSSYAQVLGTTIVHEFQHFLEPYWMKPTPFFNTIVLPTLQLCRPTFNHGNISVQPLTTHYLCVGDCVDIIWHNMTPWWWEKVWVYYINKINFRSLIASGVVDFFADPVYIEASAVARTLRLLNIIVFPVLLSPQSAICRLRFDPMQWRLLNCLHLCCFTGLRIV